MAVSAERGGKIIQRLADILMDKGEQAKLRREYAFQVRKLASANAAGRPTPQARMAAQGLRVKGGTVLGFPSTRVGDGTRMGGVSFGAEYGSNVYPQFAPRRESGYFLNPAAERVNDAVGNSWLDDAMDKAGI